MSFTLGQVVTTAGLSTHLSQVSFSAFINKSLQRHKCMDWGDVSEGDALSNDYALKEGSRIISSYTIPLTCGLSAVSTHIWIITEAVGESGLRASTCILFPHEY